VTSSNSFIKQAANSVQLFEMNRGPGKMYSSNSSAPAYNLLDHPEVRRPQMSNESYQNESRRIDYNRSHGYNFFDQRMNNPPAYHDSSLQGNANGIMGPRIPPPPYAEEYSNETQPLLHRVQSIDSMDEDMNNQSNFDEMRSNLKLGMSCVWAILAGVTYASCRVMLKNVQLNAVDLTITSALVQIFVSVTFVTCCQCQRLWPKPPAGNYHKIFLVLYSFLFGIQSLCGIEVFNMLHFTDAEAAITLISVTTPILSCVILREPIRVWKLVFVPLLVVSISAIIKPPLVFQHLISIRDDGNESTMTIGLLAGVLGVAIFGGLACVAIYATGPNVNNGLLIFYSGFAAFLIGVLASKGDSEQKTGY